MKILVTVKRTPHRDSKVNIASGGTLATESIEFEINPFDELAVEEAVRIRESRGGEVVAVTVGGEICHRQLLSALAMGANRGIRVDAPEVLDSLQIAKCLAEVVRREAPDLVLSGKLAIDDEGAQIPSMLAALLGWPQANQASRLDLSPDGKVATVVCEVDAGLEEVEVTLPALVTADLRLNEPRYASVPGFLKAKKKPTEVIPFDLMPKSGATRSTVVGYRELPWKPPGVVLGGVDELVQVLSEKKLI